MSDAEPSARLEAILELILRIGEGDVDARGALSSEHDELDGIVVGLNMLAEELGAERRARVRAEELLRDELDAYEHAPGLFCSIDAASLVVLKCNETLAEALGRTKASILGRSVLELHTADCRAAVVESLAALVRGEPLARTEFELETARGEPLVVHVSASTTTGADGTPSRIRMIWRDVTVQKSLEQRLFQAQRLQSVGQLVGGIAHDFNNILTVISVTASVAKEDATSATLQQDLAEIEDAARRGADLTTGLLAFARRSPARQVPTTVEAAAESALGLLRRVLVKDVALSTKLDGDRASVLADPSQLHQVVMNLALNAQDAMPRGGRLGIEVSRARLSGEEAARYGLPPGAYVRLSVSDTGEGMTEEQLAHAFDPFFTTKPVGKGTGLGLSICHGIVTQAGGAIRLTSTLGAGTTAEVLLPEIEPSSDRERGAALAAAPRRGGETVLLVDDDPRVRNATGRALRAAGYAVVDAGSGQRALEIARAARGRIDLVVTDLKMPEMDGRALVRQLSAEGLVGRALIVSGWLGEEDRAREGEPPAEDLAFLAKPYSQAALVERVASLLGRVPDVGEPGRPRAP